MFVVRAPVGTGKSKLAQAIGAALAADGKRTAILAPTENLVRQYAATCPELVTIGHKGSYPLADWAAAKARFAAGPTTVANYYTYLAHRAYAPCVVFDEAHRLVGALQEMETIKLWEHEYAVPEWVRTTTDLHAWAASAPGDDKLCRLATRLASRPDTYTVDVGWDAWRGQTRRVLTLRPLTPRLNRPVFWPRQVRKLVLMSATLHSEDLWDLGLESRRVAVVEVGSPIPPERRPVVYRPIARPGFGADATQIPRLEAGIAAVAAENPGARGLVHTTYAIAAELKSGALGGHPRFHWHTPATAQSALAGWLRGADRPGDDRILVASGMSEGLDLVGDLARWQVVTKIGYPSKADPAVLAKLALRPDWYSWVAARELQQAVGRVCRGPEDYGVTYILDGAFPDLYRRTGGGVDASVWPTSFTAALTTFGT